MGGGNILEAYGYSINNLSELVELSECTYMEALLVFRLGLGGRVQCMN